MSKLTDPIDTESFTILALPTPACIHGAVRLMSGGPSSTEGRVEVCIDDKWSALCYSKSWDDNAASVTCRQLGLSWKGSMIQCVCVCVCVCVQERELEREVGLVYVSFCCYVLHDRVPTSGSDQDILQGGWLASHGRPPHNIIVLCTKGRVKGEWLATQSTPHQPLHPQAATLGLAPPPQNH